MKDTMFVLRVARKSSVRPLTSRDLTFPNWFSAPTITSALLYLKLLLSRCVTCARSKSASLVSNGERSEVPIYLRALSIARRAFYLARLFVYARELSRSSLLKRLPGE